MGDYIDLNAALSLEKVRQARTNEPKSTESEPSEHRLQTIVQNLIEYLNAAQLTEVIISNADTVDEHKKQFIIRLTPSQLELTQLVGDAEDALEESVKVLTFSDLALKKNTQPLGDVARLRFTNFLLRIGKELKSGKLQVWEQ